MDRESEALILELLLEDSKDLAGLSRFSSRGRDFTCALRLLQDELKLRSAFLEDQAMCLSIDRAVRSDGGALQTALVEERGALADRIEACRLAGIEPPQLTCESVPVALPGASRLAIEAAPADASTNQDRQLVLYTNPKNSVDLLCAVCQEYQSPENVTKVNCGDAYCRVCLQAVFERSFNDDGQFPPQCCGQHITPGLDFLPPDIIFQYDEKVIEFETVDRTYCSSSDCAIFLKREHIDGHCATCPTCATETCAMCKTAWHTDDCPADTGLQLLLHAAEREGWKRCTCGRMIEHNLGCNHMRCRCGRQFCYECNTPWKTCTCILFTEERLLLTAIDQVARQDAREDAPAEVHAQAAQRVEAARQNIIDQHNCRHSWRYERGRNTCDECATYFHLFTYVCRRCNRHHCATCRFDRTREGHDSDVDDDSDED